MPNFSFFWRDCQNLFHRIALTTTIVVIFSSNGQSQVCPGLDQLTISSCSYACFQTCENASEGDLVGAVNVVSMMPGGLEGLNYLAMWKLPFGGLVIV